MIQKPEGETRPTFQELLARHNIPCYDFYVASASVPSQEFDALYSRHIGIRSIVEEMIRILNEMTGEHYTIQGIYTRYVYDSTYH